MRKTCLTSLSVIAALIFNVSCGTEETGQQTNLALMYEATGDSTSSYYINPDNYPDDRASLPVGIFDSGTGGLATLNTMLEMDEFNNTTHAQGSDGRKDFESERFIFLADKANMPYGRYHAEGKDELLREHVLKDVLFLLGDKYYLSRTDSPVTEKKEPVKNLVIACNTATAYGLSTAREALESWGLGVDITGVIEAGARDAIEQLSSNNEKQMLVAILATEGTCASNGYPLSVQEQAKSLLPDKEISVIQQAGIGLAGAIDGDKDYIDREPVSLRTEKSYKGPSIYNKVYPIDTLLLKEYNFEEGSGLIEGLNSEGKYDIQLNSISNYVKYMVTSLILKISGQYPGRKLDAIILGCTHYPFVNDQIKAHLDYLKHLNEDFNKIIPENLLIIDPSVSLGKELYRKLDKESLFGDNDNSGSEFYISVPNVFNNANKIDSLGNFIYSWKYGRDINQGMRYVIQVPLAENWSDSIVRERMKRVIPYTYDLIYKERLPVIK